MTVSQSNGQAREMRLISWLLPLITLCKWQLYLQWEDHKDGQRAAPCKQGTLARGIFF